MNERKKVVLYNPRAVFYTMPLALIAIGSELDPDQFQVIIIDGRVEADPEAALLDALSDAVCLGVTVLTGAPIADALAISRAVKACYPSMPVIWGGWHPSMFGKECLQESCVDITVQGQGEATFAEIVERLANGRNMDGCAGSMYRSADGNIHCNPPRELLSLEMFRPHDYSLIDMERYFKLKGKRQLDFITSQGCNFRCAFCSDPFVYGRKWTGIEPGSIAERLKQLWHQYQFDDVNFQDETFFTRRDRVHQMAESIRNSSMRITWAATLRADQGVRMPEDTWQLCRESGLRRLLVGVESGDNALLKRIKKDITIDQVFRTAEIMRELGIAGIFPFIVGFPDESDASVKATVACATSLRRMSDRFETPIFYFKPYPGSAIVHEAMAKGLKLPEGLTEWSQFDYVEGEPGPWVSREKFRLIERFKFFLDLASKQGHWWNGMFRWLARIRCDRQEFRFPFEMALLHWRKPARKLS